MRPERLKPRRENLKPQRLLLLFLKEILPMVERLDQKRAAYRSDRDAGLRLLSTDGPELLQAIVDAYALSVAVLDESGTILHVNREWRQFADQHGLMAVSYGVGLNYLETCQTAPGAASEDAAAIAEGVRNILKGKETEFQKEYPCPCPTSQHWFLIRAVRFDLPEAGGAFRILITHEDTTSLQRERQQWSKSEERLRLLMETANILSWEADAESWRFTYAGDQAIKMLGYPVEQWYEPDFWTSHIHPDDREQAVTFCEKQSEILDYYEFEYRMMAIDGRVVWIHDLVNVFRKNGQPKTLRGFMIDITERRQMEEALRDLSGRLINAQEEERKRVARELHDDLNQRMALLSIELEQLGQTIPQNQSNIRSRIRDLRTKAQEISTEIHRMSYQLHPSKLDHLGLNAALKSFCDEISESQELNIEFSHRGFPATLPNDVTLCVFRIAQESLRNVIKHSGAREARVVLEKTDEMVRLTVSDTGCGFDTESNKMKRGLGFISMRERLRLVGGEITIHSQRSRGTQINVTISLAEQGSMPATRLPNA
jgi:PAS domain S-box-containing protein